MKSRDRDKNVNCSVQKYFPWVEECKNDTYQIQAHDQALPHS